VAAIARVSKILQQQKKSAGNKGFHSDFNFEFTIDRVKVTLECQLAYMLQHCCFEIYSPAEFAESYRHKPATLCNNYILNNTANRKFNKCR
jgi:hypothetical protein